jgi:Lon protease-like protein
MDKRELIPLFPLGLVLLSEMILPLHIFEERYKIMIAECLDADRGFGIVYYDGKGIKTQGCLARVMNVTKKYEDGKMDIMTIGRQRFEIVTIIEDKIYSQAEVIYFDDQDHDLQDVKEIISQKARELIEEIALLSNQKPSVSSLKDINPQKLSFLIAGSDGFNSDEKQEFLEMRSTANRLQKGVDALSKIIERIKINIDIRKLIDGNGHMPELLH